LPSFAADTQIFYGPPGTGKTTELLAVLERELKSGVLPAAIAYVSFTKEGTRQGVTRACEKFHYTKKDFPYFRTLHSIAFHALSMQMDSVISKEHYRMFSDAVGMRFTGYYTEELHSPDDKYLFFTDLVRNNQDAASEYIMQLDYELAKYISKAYKEFKRQFHLVDFTDMISMFRNTCSPLPVRVAFIDEAQDLTTLQWRMAEVAFRNCERIYIAGDDDQAIYQWSGADIREFLSLKGEKTVLRTSHRLPKDILAFAKTITAQIGTRIEKEYTGLEKKGNVIYCTNIEDIQMTLPGTYMFLARNNKFLPRIKRFLESKGLLYEDKKGLSIRPIDLDTIAAWDDYVAGVHLEPSRELRLRQAVGEELSGVHGTWDEVFETWPRPKRDYILLLKQRYTTVDASVCQIRVNTIHTVKGSEANHVILFLGMSKITWEGMQSSPDAEHRAFYVGATRAKDNLILVYGDEKYDYPIYTEQDVKESV